MERDVFRTAEKEEGEGDESAGNGHGDGRKDEREV